MDVLERDFYEERRRKWRRSAFWRGFLVAAVLAALIGAWIGSSAIDAVTSHIARVEVAGIITDDPERDRMLEGLAKNQNVKAVIVRINSPGGTTAGSEALFASLRLVAEKKPLVAQLAEVAASGGYVAAIAADHIVSRGNTLTGSIGVIMEYPDLTQVMKRIGIEVETVRSSELKAEPSPFRETNPAARARDQALVAESYRWFRGLVADRRGLSGTALDTAANGGVFTGRLALENGLIDEIGGEPEALAWLESRDSGPRRLAGSRLGGRARRASGSPFRRQDRVKQRDSRGNIALDRPQALFHRPLIPASMACAKVVSKQFITTGQGHGIRVSPMIKSELIQKIAEENPHLFQRDVERIVGTVFDEIIEAMAAGHRVELRGFGAFSVKRREARQGRNPRTGDSVTVEEKYVPFFKTGKLLRDRLNGG